jgi:hypothetical protein
MSRIEYNIGLAVGVADVSLTVSGPRIPGASAQPVTKMCAITVIMILKINVLLNRRVLILCLPRQTAIKPTQLRKSHHIKLIGALVTILTTLGSGVNWFTLIETSLILMEPIERENR